MRWAATIWIDGKAKCLNGGSLPDGDTHIYNTETLK